MATNLQAFLDTVAYSEGTSLLGDDGYNVIVGGQLFTSYADHPRVAIWLPRLGIHSTAAGRYQLLAHNYDAYKALLGLPDFSPPSQDAIATRQITERGALKLIANGFFDAAVLRCARIWASLPTAGYGQRETKLTDLRPFYLSKGGVINEQAQGTQSGAPPALS